MIIRFVAAHQARWLALSGALAMAAVLVWLLTAPQFRIRQIDAAIIAGGSGSVSISAAPITRAFSEQGNIFLISSRTLSDRLRAEPEISWARVEPRIDGSAEVVVQPVRAVANWFVGGSHFLIDRHAQVIAPGMDPALELVFSSPGSAQAPRQLDPAVLLTGFRLDQVLTQLGMELAYIQHVPEEGMIAQTSGGARIYLGPPREIDQKLIALGAVARAAAEGRQQLALVDLRPVERPTYRTRSGALIPLLGGG